MVRGQTSPSMGAIMLVELKGTTEVSVASSSVDGPGSEKNPNRSYPV